MSAATTADQAAFAPAGRGQTASAHYAPAPHDSIAFLPPSFEPSLTTFDEVGEDVRAATTVTVLTAALLVAGIAMALLLGV